MQTRSDRPVVLTCIGAFWPGNDSSGPNLSYRGLAEALASEFDFKCVARDRAFGASKPIVETDSWFDRGYTAARYCAPSRTGARGLAQVLKSTPHDLLVLNGFYDQDFTLPILMMRRAGLVPRRPTILSPRGEFGAGAMALKSGRKALWRSVARRTGLLSDIVLHATSEAERDVIRESFQWARAYAVAPNVRALVEPAPRRPGAPGTTRLLCLGRISRVKNLDYALSVLAKVTTRVLFDIYGPKEDLRYWAECEKRIERLPPNISVEYRGEVDNAAVPEVFATADLLFLPTMGENFGHAIFESLSCGVPVLIADTTPWRNLAEAKAGWDLPLSDPDAFARCIDRIGDLDDGARTALRAGARRAAERFVRDSGAVDKTRTMFNAALGSTPAASSVAA